MNLFRKQLEIESDFKIYKIHERVFKIGEIVNNNLNLKHLDIFINLINKGKKFISCYHLNHFHFFKNLLNNFESNLAALNKSIFLSKIYFQQKSSNIQNTVRVNQVNDVISNLDMTSHILDEIPNNLNNIKHDALINKIIRTDHKKNEKYFIQHELVDFQLSVYEFFSKNKIELEKLQKNITKDEYFVLTRFLINKPFKVVECDKNVGSAIISHDLYNKLCLKYLDTNDFKKIETDPLESVNLLIKKNLDKLLDDMDISTKLKDFLYMKNCKLGRFRLLMKIHKSKFGTRPIINSKSHPTENLSSLIDCLLKPILKLTSSYIQDSQNLLQKTKNIKFPSDCKIFSCDFEGLYSNMIDLNHALIIICDFMKDKINSVNLNHKAFYIFLKLIFENNFFKYNKKFYKQIKGIAMGTKCGPSIANVYLYIMETLFLTIHKPLYYSRYIDDIFIIVANNFDILILTKFFHNLILNIELNNALVCFLDLSCYLNKFTNLLNFSLYKKKTNTFQFLLCSSNHQKNIINNNPFGSYLRIRRICTYSHDFIYHSNILTNQLVTRGYEKKKLYKIYNKVLSLNRDILIEYKPKKHLDLNNCILFRMNFDLNYTLIQKQLRIIFKDCFKDTPLRNHKLKILNKTQSNFGSLTINNIEPTLLIFNKLASKKCKIYSCKVCTYLVDSYYLKIKNFFIPTDFDTNCNTKCAMYAINCSLCKDIFYIGETGRLISSRIKEHIRDIIHFKAYIQYNSVVSYHFNLLEHKLERDFKFYILMDELPDLKIRRDFENNTIHLISKLGGKIINDPIKIRSPYTFGSKI